MADNVGGRPSVYSDELATELFFRMAGGESVRSICKDAHMPAISTIMLWVASNAHEGFSERYAKACEARAQFWADEILDIADDGSNDWMEKNDPDNPGYSFNGEAAARSRLRVDSRKWLLSKMLPRYADKQQLEHTGKDGGAIKHEIKETATEKFAAILNDLSE